MEPPNFCNRKPSLTGAHFCNPKPQTQHISASDASDVRRPVRGHGPCVHGAARGGARFACTDDRDEHAQGPHVARAREARSNTAAPGPHGPARPCVHVQSQRGARAERRGAEAQWPVAGSGLGEMSRSRLDVDGALAQLGVALSPRARARHLALGVRLGGLSGARGCGGRSSMSGRSSLSAGSRLGRATLGQPS